MTSPADHGAVERTLAEGPLGRRLGVKATVDPDAACIQLLVGQGWVATHRLVCDQHGWGVTGMSSGTTSPVNPKDPQAVPGGSSSGCAVAVAASVVDAAVGTDTGGSIRIPATWCGVLGFRPSTGRVSTEGVAPLAPSFDTPGLMTRDLGTMQGALGAWRIEPEASMDAVRIGVALPTVPMSVAARSVFERIVARLRSLGCVDADLVLDTRALRRTFSAIQMAEAARSLAQIDQETLVPVVREQLAAARTVAPDDERAARVRRAALHLPDGIDVLVLPAVAAGPPPVNDPDTVLTDDGLIPTARAVVEPNVLAPLLGAPAVSIPVHSAPGLGIQLVAAPGADGLLLGVVRDLLPLLTDLTPTP